MQVLILVSKHTSLDVPQELFTSSRTTDATGRVWLKIILHTPSRISAIDSPSGKHSLVINIKSL